MISMRCAVGSTRNIENGGRNCANHGEQHSAAPRRSRQETAAAIVRLEEKGQKAIAKETEHWVSSRHSAPPLSSFRERQTRGLAQESAHQEHDGRIRGIQGFRRNTSEGFERDKKRRGRLTKECGCAHFLRSSHFARRRGSIAIKPRKLASFLAS